MRFGWRLLVGLATLAGVVGLVQQLDFDRAALASVATRLGDAARGQAEEASVSFPQDGGLKVGDPILQVVGTQLVKVGEVSARKEDGRRLLLALDPHPLRQGHKAWDAQAVTPRGDLLWMVRTLLPAELREEVQQELLAVWRERSERALEELQPRLVASVGRIMETLIDRLPASLEATAEERDALFETIRTEVLGDELRSALDREVVSRLKERMSERSGPIGSEIWQAIGFGQAASVGWTALWSEWGLGDEDEVGRKLARLLEERAWPVLERHAPELVSTAFEAISEGLESEPVRREGRAAVQRLLASPELVRYGRALVQHLVIENQDLRRALRKELQSPALLNPIRELAAAFEPTIERSIERMLLRDDRRGMDLQLVRVLRRMVLRKDRRFLALLDRSDPGLPLEGSRGPRAPIAVAEASR